MSLKWEHLVESAGLEEGDTLHEERLRAVWETRDQRMKLFRLPGPMPGECHICYRHDIDGADLGICKGCLGRHTTRVTQLLDRMGSVPGFYDPREV